MKRLMIFLVICLFLVGCTKAGQVENMDTSEAAISEESVNSSNITSSEGSSEEEGPDLKVEEEPTLIGALKKKGMDVTPVAENTKLVLFQGRANIKIQFNDENSFSYMGLDYIRLSALEDEYIIGVDGYEYPVYDMLSVTIHVAETMKVEFEESLLTTDLEVIDFDGEVYIPLIQTLVPFFQQAENTSDDHQVVLYLEKPTGELAFYYNPPLEEEVMDPFKPVYVDLTKYMSFTSTLFIPTSEGYRILVELPEEADEIRFMDENGSLLATGKEDGEQISIVTDQLITQVEIVPYRDGSAVEDQVRKVR